jgi:hypothetical protein
VGGCLVARAKKKPWWSSIGRCRKNLVIFIRKILVKSGYKPHKNYKINQPSIFMATHWKLNMKIWPFLLSPPHLTSGYWNPPKSLHSQFFNFWQNFTRKRKRAASNRLRRLNRKLLFLIFYWATMSIGPVVVSHYIYIYICLWVGLGEILTVFVTCNNFYSGKMLPNFAFDLGVPE